ncbi:hypothetical protein THRCLA_04652 [Thraustotheca clavata]|uniref:Uncharacterized protein n=1 Tax=Thraustotheca clavata TaxID=74557 RepID=A0A1V9ZYD4_9STRA|nr:hypothetical protein THRCLA_04652 [Thraustotheca clavata]
MQDAEGEGEILGRYERRLVEKYRFALSDVIDTMCSLLNLLRVAQGELDELEILATKKMTQILPYLHVVREKISLLTHELPLFLGYNHIIMFIKLLEGEIKPIDPRPQSWNALKLYDKDYQELFAHRIDKMTTLYLKMAELVQTLGQDVVKHKKVLDIIARKREDLVALLRECVATSRMPTNTKKHKSELKAWYNKSLAKYKQALQATPLKLEKQIQFEIRSFTESMNELLQPHAAISKIVKLANAIISNPNSQLTEQELTVIYTCIEKLLCLNEDPGEFCSLAVSSDAFLKQIELFEAAAREDLFVVCTIPLKIEFTEAKAVDSELFAAYAQDLQTRMKELHLLRQSIKYQTAVTQCNEARYEASISHQQWQQSQNTSAKNTSQQEALVSLRRQIKALVVTDGLECN